MVDLPEEISWHPFPSLTICMNDLTLHVITKTFHEVLRLWVIQLTLLLVQVQVFSKRTKSWIVSRISPRLSAKKKLSPSSNNYIDKNLVSQGLFCVMNHDKILQISLCNPNQWAIPLKTNGYSLKLFIQEAITQLLAIWTGK